VDEPAECPRCASPETERLAESPVPGVWTVRICRRCLYSWRSTEPLPNRSRDHYPARFRLTQADIGAAREVPAIPEPTGE
jgi:vanillate/4-hydroxybenzoate decarboxylase subunit D